jgi:hydrogenase maturation protein HypF
LILPYSCRRHILACGAELKNTFCVARDDYFFPSHHIGDLENAETLRSFEEGIEHFKRLFFVKPEVIVYDLHPEYLSTKYAVAQTKISEKIGVQHHYAHIVSCMADNGLEPLTPEGKPRKVIGVGFDGIGYGEDGSIWGGEFLIADYFGYTRAGHLRAVAMPGGEAAIREPWRMAGSFLKESFGDSFMNLGIEFAGRIDRDAWAVIQKSIDLNINCFQTSSMGRLFDAVSSLIGVRDVIHYEGQAAIELEYVAGERSEKAYAFDVQKVDGVHVVDWQPLFEQIVRDLRRGETRGTIASKFHNAVAKMIVNVCEILRNEHGLEEAALSGGVFQNTLLLEKTVPLLEKSGFRAYVHHRVPTNDGGISLGQAAFACLNDQPRQ